MTLEFNHKQDEIDSRIYLISKLFNELREISYPNLFDSEFEDGSNPNDIKYNYKYMKKMLMYQNIIPQKTNRQGFWFNEIYRRWTREIPVNVDESIIIQSFNQFNVNDIPSEIDDFHVIDFKWYESYTGHCLDIKIKCRYKQFEKTLKTFIVSGLDYWENMEGIKNVKISGYEILNFMRNNGLEKIAHEHNQGYKRTMIS